MKKAYFYYILIALMAVSCLKKKKTASCEFNKVEFVEYKQNSIAIKTDKTILDCLQLEIKEDQVEIYNSAKSINISFSASSENIIEEISIDLNKEVKESFDAIDEQEITLKESENEWEIIFKSDNSNQLNGFLKIYKTSDAEYWKLHKELELSEK